MDVGTSMKQEQSIIPNNSSTSINSITSMKQSYRVIIGHININSARNKFEPLVKYVGNDLNIFIVSETEIDDTFSQSQFLFEDFSKPYGLDETAKGGEVLLYMRKDIPPRYLKKSQ